MAINETLWAQAKAMFEGGATLMSIQHKTKIDSSTISKKSKKEKWKKSKNSRLIVNEINSLSEKSTLNQYELEFHIDEVGKLVKALKLDGRLDDGLSLAITAAENILSSEKVSMMDVAQFGKFQNDARVGLKTQNKFSTASTVINNTNAQQTNYDSMNDKDLDVEIDRVLNRLATN